MPFGNALTAGRVPWSIPMSCPRSYGTQKSYLNKEAKSSSSLLCAASVVAVGLGVLLFKCRGCEPSSVSFGVTWPIGQMS